MLGTFGLVMLISFRIQQLEPSTALTLFVVYAAVLGLLLSQRLKEMYDPVQDGTIAGRKVVIGARRLYLNFINLFLCLLRLLGNRR